MMCAALNSGNVCSGKYTDVYIGAWGTFRAYKLALALLPQCSQEHREQLQFSYYCTQLGVYCLQSKPQSSH